MKYLKFALCLLSVIILTADIAKPAPKLSIKVIYISGKAEFLRSGKAAWENIKKGLLLYSGDSIKTYRNSRVDLAFDKRKDNIVGIRPNTHVVLKLKDTEKIELFDGEVFSLVERIPRGSSFEIRTPTAICGARGTGWGTGADKNKTTVNAYEDDAYAKGIKADGRVMEEEAVISEGHGTVVERFKGPSALFKIREDNYRKWDNWRRGLTGRSSREKAKMERLAKDLDKIESKKERIEDRIEESRLSEKEEGSGAGAGPDPPREPVETGE